MNALEGEICRDCSHPVAEHSGSFWNADTDLWIEVWGHTGGILCQPCFVARAAAKGIRVSWRAHVWQREKPLVAWLIERGQAEKQWPTVWLVDSGESFTSDWTTDANKATRYPTKDEAEAVVYRYAHPTRGASARAVEHGWLECGDAQRGRESCAADVDGASEATTAAPGHHESVVERQGRQPALSVSAALALLDAAEDERLGLRAAFYKVQERAEAAEREHDGARAELHRCRADYHAKVIALQRELQAAEALAERRGDALRRIARFGDPVDGTGMSPLAQEIARAALADGGQNTQTTPKLEAGLGADDDGQQETQT